MAKTLFSILVNKANISLVVLNLFEWTYPKYSHLVLSSSVMKWTGIELMHRPYKISRSCKEITFSSITSNQTKQTLGNFDNLCSSFFRQNGLCLEGKDDIKLEDTCRYRVFIKYCVFSGDFKIFRTLAFLCSPSVSVCLHTPGR